MWRSYLFLLLITMSSSATNTTNPPSKKYTSRCHEDIQGFEEWGFVLYRGYFESDERWELYLKTVRNYAVADLNDEYHETPEETISAFKFHVLDAKKPDMADLIKHYGELYLSGTLPGAIGGATALYADKGAVESVLGPEDTPFDQIVPEFKGKGFLGEILPPDSSYIILIDGVFSEPDLDDPEYDEELDNDYPGYPGHFRVTYWGLLEGLWQMMWSDGESTHMWKPGEVVVGTVF